MGADQSRPTDSSNQQSSSGAATPSAGPDDFYTLLGVDEGAGELEIKKAFRKQALIWHPDKNAHRVAESTAYFSKLQEAYEILSDPQERSWYDRHRHDSPSGGTAEPEISEQELDEVLRGKKGVPQPTKRGMGTNELLRFFEAKVWKHGKNGGLNDEAGGFFQVYNALFRHLSQEENLHASTPIDWPPFGTSQTPWSLPDRSDTQVRNFYNAWSSFASEKTFDWVYMWEMDRTDERRVKRLLEKDNKKARDEARREYNETVRQLVAYLRKRDPRVPKPATTAFPLSSGPNNRNKQPTTSFSSSKPTPSSGSSTPQPQVADFTPQAWQNVSLAQLEADAALDDEEDKEVWECVVCGKEGRSEGRWKDHERSRGHLRGVERLRREMRREDRELGLTRDVEGPEAVAGDDDDEDDDGSSSTFTEEGDGSGGEYVLEDAHKPVGDDEDLQQAELDQLAEDVAAGLHQHEGGSDGEEEGEEGEGGPMRPSESKKARKKRAREEREAKQRMERELKELEREKRTPKLPKPTAEESGADEGEGEGEVKPAVVVEKSKKELRREREAKKKAAAASGTAGAGLGNLDEDGAAEKCNVCSQPFSSRTKLFEHIKKTGHALAASAKLGAGGRSGDWDDDDGPGGGKGKKKGGKRK